LSWGRGRDVVDRLLAEGRLEVITGSAADGTELVASAERLLMSARREVGFNPEAAFILAYDGARKSSTGLLAQQGLRTTSAGHHAAVEAVVRAQFGGPFDRFGSLRRRRSEIEYPRYPGDDVTVTEVESAISDAADILAAVIQIRPSLTFFR
jgi:hypothetical protein